MASSTFRPDSSGLRDVLRGGQLTPALQSVANEIAGRARANSPVESVQSAAQRNRVPARFKDSIHTTVVKRPSREVVLVVADCDAANVIENKFRPLGRAI